MKKQKNNLLIYIIVITLIIGSFILHIALEKRDKINENIETNVFNKNIEMIAKIDPMKEFHPVCTKWHNETKLEMKSGDINTTCVTRYCLNKLNITEDSLVNIVCKEVKEFEFECYPESMNQFYECQNEIYFYEKSLQEAYKIGCFIPEHFINVTRTYCDEETLKKYVSYELIEGEFDE